MLDKKIYFAGSIRGGRDDAKSYERLISWLQNHAIVLTEHVGENNLDANGEATDDRFIHNRDMQWLYDSDLVIAEVSTPSLGVGYELGRALDAGKPVIALWRESPERKLSAMIAGCEDIQVIEYSQIEDLLPRLGQLLALLLA